MECQNLRYLHKQEMLVPCGKCAFCLATKRSDWALRLHYESRRHVVKKFVTLTYADCHLHWSGGCSQLCKRDLQLYFKRLRKAGAQIRYYAVGEYGGLKHRPHYHMILFNAPLEFIIGKKWANLAKTDTQTFLNGKFHFSTDFWPYGTITVGQVSFASINYTLKYISKDSGRIPIHNRDDREKEFAIMSKGLGANYPNEKTIAWHYADMLKRCYLTIDGGVKIAMPRYYKKRIYDETMLQEIANYNEREDEKYLKLLSKKDYDKEMTIRNSMANQNFRKLKHQNKREKELSKL